MTVFAVPRLYPIVDAGVLAGAGISLVDFAHELRDAGIRFLQYRDKDGSEEEVLHRATLLRGIFPSSDSCLILNDRVRLALRARCDGVHVGQEDMPPDETRSLLGAAAVIGLSTHNAIQLQAAEKSQVDYIAIGPIFATSSKQDPDPVLGLNGVRAARARTAKPLVAIGGITRGNYAAVLQAGADSAAVISALLPRPGKSTRAVVEQLLSIGAA